MVFKRRIPRSWLQWLADGIYPPGGWGRAAQYMKYRLRRLPDAPHRIARGVFAGIAISFTPLFGLHFLGAAALAWVMRGNILAALIATFAGNPITFPFIGAASVELGNWMLGLGGEMSPLAIIAAFGRAGAEMWHNIGAIFTDEVTKWDSLRGFYHRVFLPYLVGGLPLGIGAGIVGYYLSLPVLSAYQKLRKKRLSDKLEKRMALRAALKAKAAREGKTTP